MVEAHRRRYKVRLGVEAQGEASSLRLGELVVLASRLLNAMEAEVGGGDEGVGELSRRRGATT
jgi:hypothetical protein